MYNNDDDQDEFPEDESIAYFVNDSINEIEYLSLLLKNDMNYFIELRNGIISDNRLKNKLPTKNELYSYIKNNKLDRKFANINLDDAINIIFLHTLNQENIMKSVEDLVIGLNKNNVLEKLYAYDAEYISSHHVSHFDFIDYEYDVDALTDFYNNFKNFLTLNLKSNLATFIEEYYKTPNGFAFIESCNDTAVDGKLQESYFNEFISIMNKASLLEPLIKNEDNTYIYKLPNYNELGGFFVLAENKLKFILNIMENIDEKFENSRCFSNIAMASLIQKSVIKQLTKESKEVNLTIEDYWNTYINNTYDNKQNFIKKIYLNNKNNFDITNSYRVDNYFEYMFDNKEIVLNKKYISKFIENIQKLKAKNKSLSEATNYTFIVRHVTNCKKQIDSKFDDPIEMEKIRSFLTTYASQFKDFYISRQECTGEVEYIYTTLINKRCFNSTINQNELNDNKFSKAIQNRIMKNFVTGDKNTIQQNLKMLSRQDCYNLENYLRCLLMDDKDIDLEDTINERLIDIDLKISVTDFLNALNLIRKYASTGHSYDYSWSELTQLLPFKFKMMNINKLTKLYKELTIKSNSSIEISFQRKVRYTALKELYNSLIEKRDKLNSLIDYINNVNGNIKEMEEKLKILQENIASGDISDFKVFKYSETKFDKLINQQKEMYQEKEDLDKEIYEYTQAIKHIETDLKKFEESASIIQLEIDTLTADIEILEKR